jgi:uncharacterized protein (DUF433 family)
MSVSVEYVRADEQGTLRVGNTRAMLDSILAAWGQGHSPESIRSQFPALSLEEIYGAIAWSLAHDDEVLVYLKKQDEIWRLWQQRAESTSSPLRDRLRAAKVRAESK